MTIQYTSPRVALFTMAVAGIVAACAVEDTSPPMTASKGGGAGTAGSGAAGKGQSGTNMTSSASGSGGGEPNGTAGAALAGGSGGTGGTGGGSAGQGGSVGEGGGVGEGGSGGSPVLGPICNVTAKGSGAGRVNYERWLNVEGGTVEKVPVTTPPSTTLPITKLQQDSTGLSQFGARIRGYLTAPLSGTYQFWIACDDNCQLALSTNDSPASKAPIARVEGPDNWTSPEEWNKSTSQASGQVTLEKDKKYYLEVLHKQGVGGDHVEVGWQLPGESGFIPCEVVPGDVLSPYEPSGQSNPGDAGGGTH